MPDRKPPRKSPAKDGSAGEARPPEPELRLHDRKAYVGFGPTAIAPGIRVEDFAMRVPEVSFPFDISGRSATRYQKRRCGFGYLTLAVDADVIEQAARPIQAAAADRLESLVLACRPGTLEGAGSLLAAGAPPTPFTFRVGFEADGDEVAAVVFDVRFYASSPVPAPVVPSLLADAAGRAAVLPKARRRGAAAIATALLPDLLRRVVPPRGFRIPDAAQARLSGVDVATSGVRLRFSEGAAPPGMILDDDLLLALEGVRAFAEGEDLLAQGDVEAATRYYARLGDAPDAHPFPAERALGLLAARPDAHELALDIAAALARRRPRSAAPVWIEAVIRAARGEHRKSCDRFLDLARLSRERNQDGAAFHAYAAAARTICADDPATASRALQEALALRPDDLSALTLLAQVADRARDEAGAARAYRRIAALARDGATAARAHVRLGHLVRKIEDDVAAARLHFDAALRHAPDDTEALFGLAAVCEQTGEPLRAIRCLDRIRDRESARLPDPEAAGAVGRAALAAGRVWEEGLRHDDNALLRYREAVKHLPGDVEAQVRLGALGEKLGRTSDAVDAFATALERAGDDPKDPAIRALAHRAHRALAVIARDRLRDPLEARKHLESAVALDPSDAAALREILPIYRAAGRVADLAATAEKLGRVVEDSPERAALFVEAGEIYRERLGRPDDAARCLKEALLADPASVPALRTLAELAEAGGDDAALTAYLVRLAELVPAGAERVALLRRLVAAASEGAADVAAQALERVLADTPDDAEGLGELCAIHRRRGDVGALAAALRRLWPAAQKRGDTRRAVEALKELARLCDERLARPGEALDALEKARTIAPEDAGALLAFADLSLRTEHPAAARDAYRALVRQLPPTAVDAERVSLYARLCEACEGAGDLAGAVDAARTALSIEPTDEAVGDRLDGLYAAFGRDKDRAELASARARAAGGAGLKAKAAALYATAGEMRKRLGDAPGAIRDLRAAVEAEPEGPAAAVALDLLADLAQAGAEPAEAAAYLARRAALPGPPRAAARALQRAATLLEPIDAVRARDHFAAAAARDATYAPARAALAAALARAGDSAGALRNAEAALAAPPDDPDAFDPTQRTALSKLAAAAAREQGDIAAARRHLATYVARAPADAAALAELAALHRDAGAHQALAETLAELATRLRGADAVSPLRELSELYLGPLGRRRDAVATLRQILAAAPGDASALAGLARALTEPGEARERAEILARLVAVEKTPEKRAQIELRRGEALAESGDLSGALAAFETAAVGATDPATALERVARAAAGAGDVDRELSALSRRAAIAAERDEADAAARHASLGARLSTMGRPQDARAALERAVELGLDPEARRPALTLLAALAEAAREGAAAARYLAALAEVATGGARADALVRRARLLREAGDVGAARDALKTALAAAPSDAAALGLLKAIARDAGDHAAYAEAVAIDLAQAEGEPGGAARAAALAVELGTLRGDKLQDAAGAEAAYRKAVSLASDSLPARDGLARVLAARGADAEWLDQAEAATGLVGDRADAARRLVAAARVAREKLRDDDRALRLARRAVQLDPEHTEAAHTAADLLYIKGAAAEALALYRRLEPRLDFERDRERAIAASLRLADLYVEGGDRTRAADLLERALAADPRSADAADRLYSALLPVDPARAIDRCEAHARALGRAPRTSALYLQMAEDARRRLRDPRRAVALLQAAREIAEDPAAIDARLADALEEAGDDAALAQALARQAEALRETDRVGAAAALTRVASLHARSGSVDRASTALADAEAALVEAGDRTAAAARARSRGELWRDAGHDPKRALVAFRRALELAPEDAGAAQAAALACKEQKDAAGEAEFLEIAARSHPEPAARVRAHVRLADLYLGPLETPDRAERAIAAALQIDPALPEARDRQEELLRRQGRTVDLAESLLARAQAAPADAQGALFAEAGRLFLEGRDVARGAAALEFALAANPSDVAARARYADALVVSGRAEDAAVYDRQVMEADPSHDGPFGRERSRREKAGDAAALADLLERRARGVGPADARAAAVAFLDAAKARRAHGEEGWARADETQAFRLDPVNDRAYAAIVSRLGAAEADPPVEEVLLARAEAVPAEAATVHRLRGESLAARGETAAAAEALDRCLALDPEHADALALRAEIAAEESPETAARFDEALLALAERRPVSPRALVGPKLRLAEQALSSKHGALAAGLLEGALDHSTGPQRDRVLELLERAFGLGKDKAALARVKLLRAESAPADAREKLFEQAADLAPDEAAALPALRALAGLRPDDGALLSRLAAALATAGLPAERCDALEHAADAHKPKKRRADLYLEAARVAAEQLGDEPRARGLRARARQADPTHLDALRAVIPDLRGEADPAALAEALAALVERSDDEREVGLARLDLAMALEKLGDLEGAAAIYRAIIAAGPKAVGFSTAAEHAQALFRASGDPRQAAEALVALAETAPAPALAASRLLEAAGLLLDAANDPRAAATLAERTAALVPEAAEPHALLARVHRQRGDASAEADAIAAEVSRLAAGKTKAQRLVRLAALYDRLGRSGDAAATYEMALDADAQAVEAHRALALRDEAAGNAASALRHFEAALGGADLAGPDRADVERRAARAAAATDQADRAEAGWRGLLERDGGDDEAFAALKELLRARGAEEALLEVLQRRDQALAGRGEATRPARGAVLVERGEALSRLGRGELAEAALRAALEIDPRSARALEGLRRLAEANGEPAPLIRALESELAVVGDTQGAAGEWLKLGSLYLARAASPDAATKAVSALRKAVGGAAAAGNADLERSARTALARALVRSGEAAEARRLLLALVAASPADADLLSLAADAALAAGESAEAMEHLEAVLAQRPDDASALGRLEQAAGDDPQSLLRLLERRLNVARGAERAEILLSTAKAHEAAGQFNLARAALVDALRADPAHTGAFDGLKEMLLAAGDYAGAVAALEDRVPRVASDPERARLHAEAARLRRDALRDAAGAIRSWETAIRLDAEVPQGRETLARLYREAGRPEQAEQLLRTLAAAGSAGATAALLEAAHLARSAGRPAEAVLLLRAAAADAAAPIEMLEELEAAAQEAGRGDDRAAALSALGKRLAGAPAAARYVELGNLEEQRGHPSDAAVAFEAAVEADPGNRPALLKLARLKMVLGEPKVAVAALERAALGEPDHGPRAQLLRQVGEMWLSQGEAARALSAFKGACDAAPEKSAWRGRLNAALLLGRDAEIAEAATGLRLVADADELAADAPRIAEAYLATGSEAGALGVAPLLDLALLPAEGGGELIERLLEVARAQRQDAMAQKLEELLLDAKEATPAERGPRLRALAAAAREAGEMARSVRLTVRAFEALPPSVEEVEVLARLAEGLPEERSRAVQAYAFIARRRLTDRALLQKLAALAREAGDRTRGRGADGILRFLAGLPAPAAVSPYAELTAEARARLAPEILERGPGRLWRSILHAAALAGGAERRAGAARIQAATPMWESVAAIAAALGFDAPAVSVSTADPERVTCAGGEPAEVILGAGVAWEVAGAGLLYAVGRALELMRYGVVAGADAPESLRRRLALGFWAAGADGVSGPAAEDRALAESVRPHLADEVRDEVRRLAGGAQTALAEFNADAWIDAAEEAAQRAALVVAGDLAGALWVELRAISSLASAHPTVIDTAYLLEAEERLARLARFALSDELADLR